MIIIWLSVLSNKLLTHDVPKHEFDPSNIKGNSIESFSYTSFLIDSIIDKRYAIVNVQPG